MKKLILLLFVPILCILNGCENQHKNSANTKRLTNTVYLAIESNTQLSSITVNNVEFTNVPSSNLLTQPASVSGLSILSTTNDFKAIPIGNINISIRSQKIARLDVLDINTTSAFSDTDSGFTYLSILKDDLSNKYGFFATKPFSTIEEARTKKNNILSNLTASKLVQLFNKTKQFSYNESTEVLSYNLSDYFNSNIPVNAYVYFPKRTPKGVILFWNGTEFPDENKTNPNKMYDKSNIKYKDYVLVQPFLIGFGDSYMNHHQRWMIFNSIKYEGNSILNLVYNMMLSRYQLDNNKIDLYQIGLSQGAAYSFSFHMEFQNNTTLNQLYSLKHSYASAGQYNAEVLIDSTLSNYNDYTSSSYVTNSISSSNILSISKHAQNIILAHLLYTYHNFYGRLQGINYVDGFFLDAQRTNDDFQPIKTLISDILSKDFSNNVYDNNPYIMTDESWNVLTGNNPSNDKLKAFIRENSVLNYYFDQLSQNSVPLTLTCADNDINVLSDHTASLAQYSFPKVNINCLHDTDSNKTLEDPTYWHGKSHELAIDLLESVITN